MQDRPMILNRLRTMKDRPAPVLIVGGGINGIGLFRDLAQQGIPAILVEKGDFSSGTSAAPTRLIHGGLRYLETGEFALVRESVIERNHLLVNAPHLMKPLPVWVPAFNWFGGAFSAALRFFKLTKTPGAKGILVVKLGLLFFDWFGRDSATMPRHRLVSQREARERMPGLSPKVAAVAEYYDTRLRHPERLALELIKDGERDCPEAFAAPYVSLAGQDGAQAVLRDEITGETFTLTPQLVVNCSGVWADQVNRRMGIDKRLMGGTRGSHLVMRRPDLAKQLRDGMIYFETHDFRACLVYTLDEELVILGATDIRDESPDTVRCTDDEIAYLFNVLEQVMPGAKARADEIVFAYSGIRPLPYSGEGATGAISRDHSLQIFEADSTHPFPVITLVGGKWTTYRACAEQIADAVLTRLGKRRTRSTLHEAIGGGVNLPAAGAPWTALVRSIASTAGVSEQMGSRLLLRYGTVAQDVAAAMAVHGAKPIAGSTYHNGEMIWIIRNERVTRLADIILRRTLLPFEGAITPAVVAGIADIAAAELGWDQARTQEEVTLLVTALRERHRVPGF